MQQAEAPRLEPVAPAGSRWLDRRLALAEIDLELVAFLAIVAVALLLRLTDLGPRAFHHDESIHARFAWQLFRGEGYKYDPTYHGPFLYQITALAYFLFGVGDTTARLMPALFGTLLVALPWWLRPYLGRTWALVASVLLAISPSVLYYSRSLRHDIFALTAAVALVICIIKYLHLRQSRYLYLGAVALAVAYSSHELTFLLGFIFASFLGAAYAYERWRKDEEGPLTLALAALWPERRQLLLAVGLFVAILALLYTNFFANPGGFIAAFTDAILYWASQQDVARGGQPAFYYLMLLLVYEPLPFLLAILGVIMVASGRLAAGYNGPAEPERHLQRVRELVPNFFAYWFVGALLLFTWARERMPWLTMQIAVPAILLAALLLSRFLSGTDWRGLVRRGGVRTAILLVLGLAAAINLIAARGGTAGTPLQGQAKTLQALSIALILAALVTLIWSAAGKLGRGGLARVAGATVLGLALLYTFRAAVMLCFYNGATPVEMMVYTQTAPDIPIVARMLERLSRDTTGGQRSAADVTGGRTLAVALDNTDGADWPLNWYLRDFKSLSYFSGKNPSALPANAAVIVLAAQNEQNFQAALEGKYTAQRYKLRWWFPEEVYRTATPGSVLSTLTSVDGLTSLGRYLLYRDPGKPLGSFDLIVYVRNDLSALTSGATAPPIAAAPAAGPFDLLAAAPEGKAPGQFSLPRGVAAAPDGSIYVVDTGNGRVERFDAAGKFLTSWGGFGSGDGQFGQVPQIRGGGPTGIAVDGSGNVYVADTWNHRLQKFDGNGRFLAKWGTFFNTQGALSANQQQPAAFFGPRGIAIGPDGNLYITDTGNKRVVVYDPNGRFVRQWGSGLNGSGQFDEPIGIAVAGDGTVFVADTRNRRIERFAADGTFQREWKVDGWDPAALNEPYLALDAGGQLLASDPARGRVLVFDREGNLVDTLTGGAGEGLRQPTGLVALPDGILAVSSGNHAVVKLGLPKR